MNNSGARDLLFRERELLTWLLLNGHSSARVAIQTLPSLRVADELRDSDSLTILFAPLQENIAEPAVMLAEFVEYSEDRVTTVVLFGRSGAITKLFVWAAEGGRQPTLPLPGNLREIV